MAVMNYETPGLTEIDFEDSLFVTTELNKNENAEVKGYIEERGGVIKSSVTKTTNYLIYKDGEEETTKYKKALELVNEKGLEINILPLSLLMILRKGIGTIEFGSYPYEADGTKKPIKWIILKKEKNKALLLSAFGIDAKPYNEEYEDVTWETCALRKWLNEDFLDAAFTEEEKERIILTKVKNPDNPRYKTTGGNDTDDKVFLLSLNEARQLLQTDMQRMTSATPYAKKQGAYVWYNGNSWWWLRSPGYYSCSAARVGNDGDVDGSGNTVHVSNDAVCPALWIDLES